MAATLHTIRTLALALPGVEEGVSYGTPAFRVGKKLFLRMHDSGEALVVRVDDDQKETLMAAGPKTFFITDHYRGHPWVLVRLATVRKAALREAVQNAWRLRAPRKLVADYDSR